MQFIIFSGLPGSGKSRLSEEVGRIQQIPVFAKDWLEGTLKKHGIESGVDPAGEKIPLGYVGYELLGILARRQLLLDQSVILDSVASTKTIREQWRALAWEFGARWRVIECICSDESIHRARLATRQ